MKHAQFVKLLRKYGTDKNWRKFVLPSKLVEIERSNEILVDYMLHIVKQELGIKVGTLRLMMDVHRNNSGKWLEGFRSDHNKQDSGHRSNILD